MKKLETIMQKNPVPKYWISASLGFYNDSYLVIKRKTSQIKSASIFDVHFCCHDERILTSQIDFVCNKNSSQNFEFLMKINIYLRQGFRMRMAEVQLLS